VVMISPDGKRVLGDHLSAGVWVLELATGVTTRLGFDATSMSPIWSPDGKYVAWFRSGGIYREAAIGAGENQLPLKTDLLSVPKSWSPDPNATNERAEQPAPGRRFDLHVQVKGDDRSKDLTQMCFEPAQAYNRKLEIRCYTKRSILN
jgi:Tol biopolymer transport system component